MFPGERRDYSYPLNAAATMIMIAVLAFGLESLLGRRRDESDVHVRPEAA